jgi:SPP1 gp7 family putative phage head morphogenesis protein
MNFVIKQSVRGYDGPAVTKLLHDLRGAAKDPYWEVYEALRDVLAKAASTEVNWVEREFSKYASELHLPKNTRSVVTTLPFEGRVLNAWTRTIERDLIEKIRDAIVVGLLRGSPSSLIEESLVGSPRQLGRGGVYGKHRLTARAVARSAFIHTTSQAREMYFEANASEIEGILWVATLDSRTCPVCAVLDGTVYPVNQGPRPPEHHQCRCWTTPVLRGDETPNVPTFVEWITNQPEAVQNEVLGVKAAKLWRSGEVEFRDFVDSDGDILTLDQVARLSRNR